MINDKNNNQNSGDDSTNYQAKSITINHGISYSDAKEIALDVYKSNFIQLSKEAAIIATERAEELTDNFLKKLQEENAAALSNMQLPSMQAALFEAQKQYAKTGDSNLEELLVDILVERAGLAERSIQQIVLDEALNIASKLTQEQIDALTINFIITKTSNNSVTNIEKLTNHLITDICPFINESYSNDSLYDHLAYAGCVTLMETSVFKSIPTLLLDSYSGLFIKGFAIEEFESTPNIKQEITNQLLMRCFHDINKYQFNTLNDFVLQEKCNQLGLTSNEATAVINFNKSTLMNETEAKNFLMDISPKLTQLLDCWGKERISKISLTTVGIAIAQANFRRKTNQKLNLSIWVK